jgi:hypothetical protein
MKRVLAVAEQTTISIKDIVAINDNDGIIALKKEDMIYIVVGLVNTELFWAFHPLIHDGTPIYQRRRLTETLTKATSKHEVFFFETEREFLEWALGDNNG